MSERGCEPRENRRTSFQRTYLEWARRTALLTLLVWPIITIVTGFQPFAGPAVGRDLAFQITTIYPVILGICLILGKRWEKVAIQPDAERMRLQIFCVYLFGPALCVVWLIVFVFVWPPAVHFTGADPSPPPPLPVP